MTRWLDEREQRVWRAWLLASTRLEAHLARRMQADGDISMSDFAVLVQLSEAPEGRLRAFALTALATVLTPVLLSLPVSSAAPGGTDFRTALFTATSAACVTGLVVVDTGTYWSGTGEVILLVLIQLGGLGVMTFASLLGLLVAGRLGLRSMLERPA